MAAVQTEEKQSTIGDASYWGNVALKVGVGALVGGAIAATGGVAGVPLALAFVAGGVSSFGEEGVIRATKAVGSYAKDHLMHQAGKQQHNVADAMAAPSEDKQVVVEKNKEVTPQQRAYVNPNAHTHHLADLQQERNTNRQHTGPTPAV